MGKKKYNKWLGDPDYDARDVELGELCPVPSQRTQESSGGKIPPPMILPTRDSPGFFLGLPSGLGKSSYVGIPQETEGHITVVGGSGSGKSTGIAKPTLGTWGGAICATDVKGELSEFYEKLYLAGHVTRPYVIFDPMDTESPSYDPFDLLFQDDEAPLVSNIMDIVRAIAPVLPNDIQPFWTETEQGVLAAALLYYFEYGLSFSEAIITIMAQPASALCERLNENADICKKFFLGETAKMKPETLANIDRGLRNKLMLFATDPYISHAFRGKREGAVCFTWEDLDTHNIFLRIPADKIEQWSGAVNLMYSQLIRHFERRPEKYSPEGANNIQTLLLMDEFARFGKLEMITGALATLRSKNVNICLVIQSIAQLDRIYGECERRVIFDNCQYQAILRANDAGTQKYLCELIGTRISIQRSVSEHMDDEWDTTGYGKQISEVRDWIVQPHELSTLSDVLLLTPYGFCRAEKFRPYKENMKSMPDPTPQVIRVEATATPISEGVTIRPTPGIVVRPVDPVEIVPNISKKNEGATIMSIEERSANADKRIRAAEQRRRQDEWREKDAQKRKDQRRNYVIGELVTRYFPTVREYEPGTNAENLARFESLEAFLYVLSLDPDLVDDLQDRAAQLVSEDPDGEWRAPM